MLADDHSILRAGLRMLIDAQEDMEVVAEAADGEKAIQAARETSPDVAVLDLTMPRVGGMKALQEIVRTSGKTRVLILTMHEDPAYLKSAMAAGAAGFRREQAIHAGGLQGSRGCGVDCRHSSGASRRSFRRSAPDQGSCPGRAGEEKR